MEDAVIREASDALRAGGGGDPKDVSSLVAANKELLTLHELIAHRLFQILVGAHKGRVYSV
jgi:xylose isomerase